MALIHPTAVVEPGAELEESVVVGPFCHVGPAARLGARCRLEGHVVVAGATSLGEDCRVFPFACLGHAPQDQKYRGEPSRLVIGPGNVIREHVTMHPGTASGTLETVVGEGCLIMAGVHVAHDCRIGSRVVMANGVTLGGHVGVGDFAVLGGLVAVHQHVRIGAHAMVGGLSGVESDVIPYGSAVGNRATLCGLNTIGMKRRGVPRDEIRALRHAYRILFAPDGSFAGRLAVVAELYADRPRVGEILAFVRGPAQRPLCRPRRDREG
ncbi:MAG TPA: acyl-ACP--UDP-N-acetylglucosamine O-acyltransferase [Geminicoccaceae bacterium]|nr:acyl-ACP--UDP-N-acetylglucosamine O-acyltransferase [Geminicoccaceae bacterium]